MTEQLALLDSPCSLCGGDGRIFDQRLGTMRMCDCRAVRLPAPDVNPDAPAGIEAEDERWHTLPELCESTGFPAQSVSARIRDLRKQKYGAHKVHRESLGKGLFRYRLEINRNVFTVG